MTRRELTALAERAAVLLYPRVCPLCGALLGPGAKHAAVCPACAGEEERLAHLPPRLPEGDHDFYALSAEMAAYYYADSVRSAILRCKRGGQWWYARELADRMAVRIFGAEPAAAPGRQPQYAAVPGLPLYHALVPVPPRQTGSREPSLPLLLAKRLGTVLQIPVLDVLQTTRTLRPQKELDRALRILNVRDAYVCRSGTEVAGKRILVVDDIITTGSTVSACAMALLQAGAFEVHAAAIAADEELPKNKRKPTENAT